MNLYSEVPWSVLCGEVSKLEVAYPVSNVVELRRADVFDSAFDSGEFSREKVVEAAGVEPASGRDPRERLRDLVRVLNRDVPRPRTGLRHR